MGLMQRLRVGWDEKQSFGVRICILKSYIKRDSSFKRNE